ncbi:hypothetical protein HN865_01160 [Candidatus Woesearchaeota archaeon]|jgi:hypothetical protein|nr:hypothetical protein [Candidatus Woesearchaeota archaeon]MBT7237445.1 hypothetical protein [Candidatus Woesearchaeota archaeon]
MELPGSIAEVVKMALYHPEKRSRSSAIKHLEESSYRVRSCFQGKNGAYMRLEERDGLEKDIWVCGIPEEYFGVEYPESHPFIVTIAE